MHGERLRQLRKGELGNGPSLTQEELAELTGVPQRTISAYEKARPGERKPSRVYLRSLADHFGVTERYLLGETDNPEYDTRGGDGERSRRQLVTIHDALPPPLQHSLVELARGLLRLAAEREQTQDE